MLGDDKKLLRKVREAVKVTSQIENKELAVDLKETRRKVNANYNSQALKNKDFEHELEKLESYKKGIWALGVAFFVFLLNALLELVKK